jgi:hypothetical protein
MINHTRKQIDPLEEPLFKLGKVVATPSALVALAQAHQTAALFLGRHVRGDWGDVDKRDARLNHDALADGSRLFSIYTLASGARIWVITEAGRAVTTILLPQDY